MFHAISAVIIYDIFRSDSDSNEDDQNNERFYHVKQTVENRRPSKMGDVATLLFVHFNFIIQLRNMFLFLKSIHIAYLSQIYALFIEFYYALFFFVFFKDMHYNTMIRTFCILKKNDVQCFSLPDFVGPLWGIKDWHILTNCIYFNEKHILWIHFGENFIDIWGGADFGPYSSQSFHQHQMWAVVLSIEG